MAVSLVIEQKRQEPQEKKFEKEILPLLSFIFPPGRESCWIKVTFARIERSFEKKDFYGEEETSRPKSPVRNIQPFKRRLQIQ